MITNDRQYKIAKSQIQDFQQALSDLLASPVPENVHPKIFEAHKGAVESQLQELISQVNEYETLKTGKVVITEVKDLQELPLILIKARIANGLTQGELAKSLGLKEQQIQRYESELYNSASLKTLIKIAETLHVELSGDVQIKSIESAATSKDFDINSYPFKEMFKRKWFGELNTLNDAVQNSSEVLFRFFDKAGLANLRYSLTKKSIRSGSSLNEFALNAWYARVVIKARDQELITTFDRNVINHVWLKNLAALRTR